MSESITKLTDKEVINICDGKKLGYVTDFEIDVCSGKITCLIIPSEQGFFGIRKCRDIIIPWEKICKIGDDAILVDVGVLPCLSCDGTDEKRKNKVICK